MANIDVAAALKRNLYSALVNPTRSPEIPEAADVYGWLVGDWNLDVLHYGVDVRERNLKGEVSFAWVLEGRAVQDVWIMPRRMERGTPVMDKTCNMYGVTLRVWDPALQAWRVTWINGVTGGRSELIGRWRTGKAGREIAQVGTHSDGTPIRWIFSEITEDSFRWTGEALEQNGSTWKLQGEFRAVRVR